MKLLVIHLSDIHIRGAGDFILKRADKIADAVAHLDDGVRTCVVAVTGDIAYSGSSAEYALAETLFTELRDRLKAVLSLDDVTFVFAPGNHDCDFTDPHQLRDIVVGSLIRGQTTEVGDELVVQCTVVQSGYRAFVARFNNSAPPSSGLALMREAVPVSVGDRSVVFRTYNTAWMSQKHETQGELMYPMSFALPEDDPSALVVAMFHHPYNWLEANNARTFRRHIEHSADLILTGHEHEAGQYTKTSRPAGIANEYCEGAVLQDAKSSASGFNVVIVDLDSEKQKVLTCDWDGRLYDAKAVQATWQEFQRNQNRVRNEFIPSADTIKFITSPGAGYTHPRKEHLELDDIFIEPNLRETTKIDARSQLVPPNLSGEQFWRRLQDEPYVAVLGDEASGKTTMCKRLFARFHAAGSVPIMLHGEEIKGCDWDRLVRMASDAVAEQYSPALVERYRQLDKGKRVLLLDNYHFLALNRKGCAELFEHITNFFGRVVLFAHNLARVEELSAGSGDNPLLTYTQFELLEFGHALREELIERWLSIGQEYTVPDAELDVQVVRTKGLVDALLGRNLLPSHPIYILIVIQQIEAQTNLNTSSGALGYLYEALITGALSKIGQRLALDTAYTYLSEVAHRMFTLKSRKLTIRQLEELHREYCAEYKVDLRFDAIHKALIDAGVLAEDGGTCGFKFKYFYYYFAARHLRDRLTADDGKAQLRELTTHVYKEEFANILVFLTYLSRDSIVIDEMLRAAKSVYPDVEPCDLSAHTKFVAGLLDQTPPSVLVDADAKTTRKEINKSIDGMEAQLPKERQENDLDDVLRLNVAFKTIQILGQILKNFPGSLKGDTKLEIARECYFLGLRTMRALLNIIEQNRDDIIAHVVQNVLASESGDSDAKDRKAKRIVTGLIEIISVAIIKKISGSVGSESLSQTYEEVLGKHNTLAVQLIDLSVKLDHFRSFPSDEFAALIEDNQKALFPTLILRSLALNHFYRFPVQRETKHRVCGKLGIKIKTVNLLEQKRLRS